jgi:HEAT repeat protein
MKKILALFVLSWLLLPPLAARAQETDVASLTDRKLIEILSGDPAKKREYQLRNAARKEVQMRGATPGILSGLIGICQQGPSEQTRLALELLRDFQAKEAVPVFTYYLWVNDKYSSVWKDLALTGLEKIGDPSAVGEMARFYFDPAQSAWRERTVLALGKSSATTLIPEFKEKLTDFHLGAPAALALAEMGDKSGRETARRLLSKNKHGLEITALRALGKIGNKGDLGLVGDLERKFNDQVLTTDWLNIVRFQIETGGQTSAQKTKKLAAILAPNLGGQHKVLVDWAVEWLGSQGGPEALEELQKLATGPVPFSFRLMAVRALRACGYKVTHQKAGMNFSFRVEAPATGGATAASVSIRAFRPEEVPKKEAGPAPTAPPEELDKLSDAALLETFQEEVEGDRDYEKRSPTYLEILVRGKSSAFIQGLIGIIQKGSITQKAHAVMLLGDLGAREAVPAIVQLLNERTTFDQLIYGTVLYSLPLLGGDEAVKALTELFYSSDPQLYGDESHVYPLGDHALRDNIEIITMLELAELGQTQLIPEFKKVFERKETTIHPAAALAMAKLGDKSLRNWAREKLTKKDLKNIYAFRYAIEVLGAIGDYGDMGLIESLQQEKGVWKQNYVSLTTAQYQIGMKHEKAEVHVKRVSHFLTKPVPYMAPWAVKWLGKNGTPEALEVLKKAINERELKKVQMDIVIQLRRNGIKVAGKNNHQGGYYFLVN